MPADWVDRQGVADRLRKFFSEEKAELSKFGSTINQVFESYVFASTASRYRALGWSLRFHHPPPEAGQPGGIRLKFSTRGRPSKYSYVECGKKGSRVQIRHQLRVETYFYVAGTFPPANIVLDVAVVRPFDDAHYTTNDPVPNDLLVTFGEAKHMSAFAELVAGFLGVVHEMQPFRLMRTPSFGAHVKPFLFVSGFLNPTAKGLLRTIEDRGYDVELYSQRFIPQGSLPLPVKPPPQRRRPGPSGVLP